MEIRKKIGIDFDDVLFSFNSSYLEFHNRSFGTNLKFDDITNFDMEKVWQMPMEKILPRVNLFCNSSDHAKALPIDGAPEAIQKLKDIFDIYVITSRSDFMKELTIEWLSNNIPYLKNRVHFTNQFQGEVGKMRNKSDVCKELGIDVFIDDAVVHARDISNVGVKVLLFDKPWNRKYKNEDIKRVFSWSEITEQIMKL